MPRLHWIWLLVVLLLASPSGVAHADPSGDTSTVSVTGDVRHPLTLQRDGLQAYPPQTQSVTFGSSAGPQTHTYEGAALYDVLTAADPSVDAGAKHPLLAFTVLATGADGYSAAVSWGEISPDLAATPVIVAYTEDGRALDRPRLVVPGDVEGARYVSDLNELRVVNLGVMPR